MCKGPGERAAGWGVSWFSAFSKLVSSNASQFSEPRDPTDTFPFYFNSLKFYCSPPKEYILYTLGRSFGLQSTLCLVMSTQGS